MAAKLPLLLCLGLATAVCAAAIPANRWENDRELNLKMANPVAAFEDWVEEHSAPFIKGTEEWAGRYELWLENLHKVLQHNALGASYWLTMNKFAAMSQEEFHLHYLGLRLGPKRRLKSTSFTHAGVNLKRIPESMDWREKNAVTPVKNQKHCGSCWSFATTGAIEGANAIFTGNLTSLSEQELMDCDTTWNHGCNGGIMDNAFEWVIDNGGLTTEKEYPYEARKGKCNKKKVDNPIVSINDYVDCPAGQNALLKAVSQQPVSTAMNGEDFGVQLYGGGIYDNHCSADVNHGVLVVGYSLEPMNEYFLVKNSWGTEWGEHGYIKMALGKNGDDGQCGITMRASYPVKTSPNPTPAPPPVEPIPKPEPPAPVAPKPSPKPKPPVPPPGPQLPCDAFNECSKGETCCCVSGLFGVCFTYGCCPFKDAVCCSNGVHCCPAATPVCNLDDMECTSSGMFPMSSPMGVKRPARRVWPWSNRAKEASSPRNQLSTPSHMDSETQQHLAVS